MKNISELPFVFWGSLYSRAPLLVIVHLFLKVSRVLLNLTEIVCRSGNDVTESRQRDDDKRSNKSITSSSVSASGTNLSKHSGSSDSFTPDDRKEAKKELERIQRRIAELKGTRVDGEDEDNNKTTEPAERFVGFKFGR